MVGSKKLQKVLGDAPVAAASRTAAPPPVPDGTITLENLIVPYAQAYPLRDFLLLAGFGMRTALRYQRPFSVIDIALANAEALRKEVGNKTANEAFRAVVELVVQLLRSCDLVAAQDDRVVIALPETKAAKAGIILWRLKNQVTHTIQQRIHLECRVTQGTKGLELIKSLGARLRDLD